MPQASDPAEDSAVGGENAAEVRVRLQGCDEPVRTERHDPGSDPDPSAVLPHSLPDEPGTADLGEGRQEEQQD